MKFGLERMPVGARMGDQLLILAYFGIKHTHNEPLRPNQSSFCPQNTTSILLLWYKLILDVEIQVWRGAVFDSFWHLFTDFF